MTDPITLPRATVQQALEAIDLYQRNEHCEDELLIAGHFLRTALEQQQAEPVQEPFGYLWPTGSHPEFRFTQQKRDGADGMPLYTTPPQRKPLTDEQVHKAMLALNTASYGEFQPTFEEMKVAIEAAHGIKEGT